VEGHGSSLLAGAGPAQFTRPLTHAVEALREAQQTLLRLSLRSMRGGGERVSVVATDGVPQNVSELFCGQSTPYCAVGAPPTGVQYIILNSNALFDACNRQIMHLETLYSIVEVL
jgi:hypothetical protein